MRIELQSAYVLHTRPFRDTSLLVDFFTQDHGRVTLIAKGARSPKQRQRQLLQPFSPLTISWQGKGDLKTLISVEASTTPFVLRSYFLYSALYANELLVYLLAQNDTADDIYTLYHQFLTNLQEKIDLEPTLRFFEFSLLNFLGYGINFELDAVEGEPIKKDNFYRFQPDTGFILEEVASQIKTDVYQGCTLINISQHAYIDSLTRQAAKNIARVALSGLLQGKPIKSRELFN